MCVRVLAAAVQATGILKININIQFIVDRKAIDVIYDLYACSDVVHHLYGLRAFIPRANSSQLTIICIKGRCARSPMCNAHREWWWQNDEHVHGGAHT